MTTNTDCFIALSTNAHTDYNVIQLKFSTLANMNIKSLIEYLKQFLSWEVSLETNIASYTSPESFAIE